MNIKNDDRDFVVMTKFTFEQFEKIIHKQGRIIISRPEYFTIKCRLTKDKNDDSEVFDFVFPRTEGPYLNGRHPSYTKIVKSLQEDSLRRDFTINSMYMSKEGNIIDFHNAKRDIDNKIIRTVGSPDITFRDDFLRILRAIRFAIQFNFVIETQTFNSMLRNREGLKKVEINRIREEVNKMLKIDVEKTFQMLTLFEIMPIIKKRKMRFILTTKK